MWIAAESRLYGNIKKLGLKKKKFGFTFLLLIHRKYRLNLYFIFESNQIANI